MFFICSISSNIKELEFLQTTICKNCGQFGRLNVFITYNFLSFFFIPLFKWGKKYYAKTSCCGTVYSIDPDIGKQIEHGEHIEIKDSDLQFQYYDNNYNNTCYNAKHCPNCGYELNAEFDFCPKCGTKL